jgi:hypothetical protein
MNNAGHIAMKLVKMVLVSLFSVNVRSGTQAAEKTAARNSGKVTVLASPSAMRSPP